MMISGSHSAFTALQDTADRTAQIAQSIANGGPVYAHADANPASKQPSSQKVEALSTPASIAPDASPAMQLIDLKQTELVFKTSALAARTLIESSQELMDALR
ncbi:MAG: hypothetical protein OIF58_07570 [Cohaesibacter sp.]|nr:hypothetical protein [Cohaesibacter sp.]